MLARRLVEAGVTFITIHTESRGNGHWDTHNNNFNDLKDRLLPIGNQRHLAKLIPHARLVTYADAAHGFFFQHERDFANRMGSFLGP